MMPKEKKDPLPANLQNARREVGLRQVDVMIRLELSSPSVVSGWEQGVHTPSIEMLRRLAELYGTTVGELIG